jgi:hypothetical protein
MKLATAGQSTTVRTVEKSPFHSGISNFEVSFTNYQHLVPEAKSQPAYHPRSGEGSGGPISGVTWTVVDSSECHTKWDGTCDPSNGLVKTTTQAGWMCDYQAPSG